MFYFVFVFCVFFPKGFVTGATKVSDVIGAEIMQSKNNTCFTLWSLSQSIIKFSSSILRLYRHLFKCWCCRNCLCAASSFLGTKNAMLEHINFCNLGKTDISAVPRHIFILLNWYRRPKNEPKFLKTSLFF